MNGNDLPMNPPEIGPCLDCCSAGPFDAVLHTDMNRWDIFGVDFHN